MSKPDTVLRRGPKKVLGLANLQDLFSALSARGYQLAGPTVREGTIVYDRLASVQDLPVGWSDEQDGGTYRLRRRDDGALFGFAVGPHSLKKFLLPPVTTLWRAERSDNGFKVIDEREKSPRYAFIGVRSCELHAIAIQDRVFLDGPYTDTVYLTYREDVFTVAVNCGQAGGTCFCTTVEDATHLQGLEAQRVRKWDSCFTMDFSYIHGGSIRASPKSRYRQWMTHKLASWIGQFGTSGCVGCGRCITWCPLAAIGDATGVVVLEGVLAAVNSP